MIEKVVSFITRKKNNNIELLLFKHPSNDIQVPAGTVDEGEDHFDAAIREGYEETGLNAFKDIKLLGYEDIHITNGEFMIEKNTKVYSRPNSNSLNWIEIRRGIYASDVQYKNGYNQITYQEYDDVNNPNYISYQITGWVPRESLTKNIRRFFYRLNYQEESEDKWEWITDNHSVEIFWVPIKKMPIINNYQQRWLKYLIDDLKEL